VAERYGANDFTSIPAAGVLAKRSNGEVGVPDAVVRNKLAIANGARILANMMPVGRCQAGCETRP